MTLQADANKGGELQGAVRNFSTITKTGAGEWLILGSVPRTDPNDPHSPPSPITGSMAGVEALTVEEGTLILAGANPDFDGDVDIWNGGTLNVQAQGINKSASPIMNSGTLIFDQPFDDTFGVQIINSTNSTGNGQVIKQGKGTLTLTGNNTYSGGTIIGEGTLAISDVDNIGTGGLQFIDTNNTVTQGTLQALADLDLTGRTVTLATADGATGDTSFGVINTNGHDVETQSIVGTGSLAKTGAGTLYLDGTNAYAGVTNVYGGILEVMDGASVTNTTAGNVDGGSTLRVMGTFGQTTTPTVTTIYQGSTLDGYNSGSGGGRVNGDVVNASGNITPGITGDGALNATDNRTLTINGKYSTSGGPPSYVNINTVLNDGVSPGSGTSHLAITGTATGSTWVYVTNQGGMGDQTAGAGIDIISTGSSSDDTFRLKGTGFLADGTPIVTAGDWGYALIKGGQSGQGGNTNDWYLVSVEHGGRIITPPDVTVFDTVALAAQPFNLIGTLTQRVGNRSWAAFGRHRQYLGDSSVASSDAYASQVASERRFAEDAGIWTRIEGAKVSLAPRTSNTHQGRSSIDFWRAELGFDMPLWRPSAGSALIGGFSGHFAGTDNDIKGLALAGARGFIKSNGYGFGATLTWYGEYGFYADAVAKWTWYESDIKSSYGGTTNSQKDNNGFGQVYSLEIGKTINICKGFSITPQAQYVHSSLQNDSFRDIHNDKFSYKNTIGKLARVGVAANREWFMESTTGNSKRFELYGVANMYREFDSKTRTKHFDSTANVTNIYKTTAEKWWAGASAGATIDWCDNKYSVYGEVGYRTTLKNSGKNHILHGEIGFRHNF